MVAGIDEHVSSMKVDGNEVTVTSQPKMVAESHDTKFDLRDPNQCRLFLRAIENNPDLMVRVGLGKEWPTVSKAIKTLGASFKDSIPAMIQKDLATIKAVGEFSQNDKKVMGAIADAGKLAEKRGVGLAQALAEGAKRAVSGSRTDQAIARALE